MLPEDPVRLRRYATIGIILASLFFGQKGLTWVTELVNVISAQLLPPA